MNIQVEPKRLLGAAGDLRQNESKLIREAANIESIAKGLRHNGDDSLQAVARKLDRIAENIRTKARVIHMMSTAVEKIASLYGKTEDGIRDHEDYIMIYRKVKYAALDIRKTGINAAEKFIGL